MLSTEAKAEIVDKFQRHPGDTGSPEVQVALLSASIGLLTEHLKAHKKDFHSRRGLIAQVTQRRRCLNNLKVVDLSRYLELIAALGIRK